MTGFDISEGTTADIDDVMAVMNNAFDPRFGEAWNAGQCLSMMSLPGTFLVIARQDGEPVGFALNRHIVDEVELLLLAVTTARRRQGTARRLIDAVRQLSLARGASHVHLEVRDNNPAYLLYVNAGFSLVGRRTGYYRGANGEAFDALTLSCQLDHGVDLHP
ncbi:GNAT family N-acetyltransferase [Sphingomonas montanisoli]|uniref:GNAT family N-acetyltransferase n=1 Tax=Sphingomonas montanisoli TaxID=2606412 RepID=A0A5D9C9L0_9SPHN|nr:N-acetyltransferase [Sphingomonas montanisoli]TZG28013.1 GNAT family N-acetyltransferase [Sphingomonas montanisoli]